MHANEVKNKSFKQKLNGYSKEEVQTFQKEVMQTIENLETSNQHLQQELFDANQKIEDFMSREATLNRSIIVAQEAADRLREKSLSEAETIIAEAESEAKRILTESAEKATAVNSETDQLQETARTLLHQTLGLVAFTKETLEDGRWEKIFDDSTTPAVPTPHLDEVLSKYQLPVRNNKAGEIFEIEAERLESGEKINNDSPAIFPADVEAMFESSGKDAKAQSQDQSKTKHKDVDKK